MEHMRAVRKPGLTVGLVVMATMAVNLAFVVLGLPQHIANFNTAFLGFPILETCRNHVGTGIPALALALVPWTVINGVYVWAAIRMTARGPKVLGWAMLGGYVASVGFYFDLTHIIF